MPVGIGDVAGKKYQADSTPGNDYQTEPWNCIKFGMSQPQYYQYQYVRPSLTTMSAIAVGNLDGDTTTSYFMRAGEVNSTTQTLRLATQVQITDEFE